MGGNIDISSAKALELRATTMGGNVTVQTLGDGTIYLKSMGGNIDLTIPKTASAQVDVEVDYAGLTDQGHTITDNLGLQQQKSSSWELWRLTHRYHISARGSIGSGTNRIVIKTVGGDVTLKLAVGWLRTKWNILQPSNKSLLIPHDCYLHAHPHSHRLIVLQCECRLELVRPRDSLGLFRVIRNVVSWTFTHFTKPSGPTTISANTSAFNFGRRGSGFAS